MPAFQSVACPLCNSEATFAFADRKHERVFQCPVCIDFVVVKTANEYLDRATPELKHSLSQAASHIEDGFILEITASGSDMQSRGLRAEPVPRQSLRP